VTRYVLLATVVFATFAVASGALAPRTASADIEVRSSVASNIFPDGAQFQVFTASNSDITNVRFRYRVLPDGAVSFARTQCNTGAAVSCTAVVGGGEANLVPGAEIQYVWEIQDAAGARHETPQQSFVYDDKRFQWESVSEGNVIVYYYFGDAQSNQAALRTGRETLDRYTALTGTRIDFPVKIWVYATTRDLQAAAGNRQVPNGHTLGQVGSSDAAIVSRETDFLNIIRHELVHVVVRRATRSDDQIAGNYTRFEVPPWVNEGLATFAQTRLLPSEEQMLALAIRQNRVLPLTTLSTALRGAEFSLAYAQSGAIVGFLLNTYGQEKFAQYIAAFKTETENGALQKVYGIDQLGLENAWRRSIGLPEVTAQQTSGGRELGLPTIAPFGSTGGDQPAPATTPATGGQTGTDAATTGDSGSGSLLPLIAGGAVVAVAVLGGGFYLVRVRKKAPVA
jgi:hypothetical protein